MVFAKAKRQRMLLCLLLVRDSIFLKEMESFCMSRCQRHHIFIEINREKSHSTPAGVARSLHYEPFYKHANPPGLEEFRDSIFQKRDGIPMEALSSTITKQKRQLVATFFVFIIMCMLLHPFQVREILTVRQFRVIWNDTDGITKTTGMHQIQVEFISCNCSFDTFYRKW